MSRKLTVSELSQTLGVSVNTTWKKIKKRGLTTVKDTVNNREITFVILNDDEYDDLVFEPRSTGGINKGDHNPNYEDFETIHEGVKVSQTGSDIVNLFEKVMDYSKDMNDRIKEYVERVIEAEKQVRLLEDSEHRKDEEYHRLIAENRELKLKVAELEEKIKLHESKWWNRPVIKR